MCFSARMKEKSDKLQEHYQKTKNVGPRDPGELIHHHANGFAHPLMWIIPQEEPETFTPAMWGIMPSNKLGADHKEYYKEAVRFGAGLNAQSEKLFDHFIYKHQVYTRRCIIPVNGFYEPHTAPKKFKIPFYFELKDHEIMNLAGLYNISKDGFITFTVLTQEATPMFSEIHNTKNRRPVILADEEVVYWLDNNLEQEDILDVIQNDLQDYHFNAYPISKDLYSPKVDSNRENIVDRVDYAEMEIDY